MQFSIVQMGYGHFFSPSANTGGLRSPLGHGGCARGQRSLGCYSCRFGGCGVLWLFAFGVRGWCRLCAAPVAVGGVFGLAAVLASGGCSSRLIYTRNARKGHFHKKIFLKLKMVKNRVGVYIRTAWAWSAASGRVLWRLWRLSKRLLFWVCSCMGYACYVCGAKENRPLWAAFLFWCYLVRNIKLRVPLPSWLTALSRHGIESN